MKCVLCGLTFELTGLRRRAPHARTEMMHHVPQAGLAALAVAGPVERGVSPLCVSLNKTAHVREMKSVAICSDGVKNVA